MKAKRHPLSWGILAVTFVWAVTLITSTVHAGETELNKRVIRDFYAAYDAGNIDAAVDFLGADFVAHEPPAISPEPMNRDAYKQLGIEFREAFPDLKHTIRDQIAEGDKVATRATIHGTRRVTVHRADSKKSNGRRHHDRPGRRRQNRRALG